MLKLWQSISRLIYVVATQSQRQLGTQLPEKAFRIVRFNVRQRIKFVKKWKVDIFVVRVLGHRFNIVEQLRVGHFACLMTREGFRDILCEIVLAAWKSSLRWEPSASGLGARAVAVVCWQVPLKKAEKLSCHVSSTVTSIWLVKRVSRGIVVESEFAVKVNRHQNISVFVAAVKPRIR